MTRCMSKAVFGVVLGAGLALAAVSIAEDPMPADHAAPVMLSPSDLKWGDAPPVLPPGAKAVVMDGDPSKPGLFTMRLKAPAGYKIAPHFHGADEHITVISGALQIALGDTFDASKLKTLPAGSFGVMPAKSHHFAFTKEETVVQLHGQGPWTLTYVNPADDPQMRK